MALAPVPVKLPSLKRKGRQGDWLPLSSQETLKTSFNVSNEYQGCHPDDISMSVPKNVDKSMQYRLIAEHNKVWTVCLILGM